MKRNSTPDHRRVRPVELFAIMLVCWLPMTGYSQEPPAKDSATKPVFESPAGPNAEPVAPSTVEHPTPAAKVTAPASPPTPAQSIEKRSAPPAPESSRQPTQTAIVKGFLFKGNTVIGKEQLESITEPYIGQALELPLLESAAQAVTDYYRKKGYTLALAYVPQQDVTFGVVELAVLEGRIGDITVSGNKYYTSSFIKGHFAQAMEENVARNESLERGLLLLNEYPGLKTSATLEPGKSPGATDVHVTAKDKRPLHFMLDMNNYGFNNISRYRFGAGVEVGNVLVDGGTLTLNGIMGNHPNQLLFGMANYSMPIGVHGTKLVVGGSDGKFDVGGQLDFLQIRGHITTGDIAVTHPFIKSRFENILGEVGFSAKHNKLTLLDNLIADDDIRALKLGVNWDRLDLSGRWYASVYGFQGLGQFLGGMSDNSPQATRQNADNRFTKATIATGRIQSLGHDVLLVVKGSGQITTGPVVVIEQMLLGGPDSVRGYQLGERFVDEGYTVSAETRIPFFPSLVPTALNETQGAIFIDYGAGRLRNPSPGEQRSTSMTGTGVGLQTQLPWYSSSVRLDLGFPIGPMPIGGTVAGDRSPT
ncbi:MAG TPA: ShlB/FhaC/HecB family hemolysin secretion/activation protein, partial [Nitrospiraceae bacterium]|nr:ShlB/FhaC/HecB family hemolysin secretion/activation protein [Nitrospiraceae bacterium]